MHTIFIHAHIFKYKNKQIQIYPLAHLLLRSINVPKPENTHSPVSPRSSVAQEGSPCCLPLPDDGAVLRVHLLQHAVVPQVLLTSSPAKRLHKLILCAIHETVRLFPSVVCLHSLDFIRTPVRLVRILYENALHFTTHLRSLFFRDIRQIYTNPSF